jgi:hypothetical protein
MSPNKRISIPKAAALVLLALFAALLLFISFRASSILSGALSSYTGLDVSAGLVGFSPASGIMVSDIRVHNPPGYSSPYLARINKVSILPDYHAIMRGSISIKEVRVIGPQIYLEKGEKGDYNAVDAAGIYHEKNKNKKPSGRKFAVGLIEVSNGRAELSQSGLVARLNNAKIEGLSGSPDKTAAFSFDLDDTRGVRLTGKGSARPFSTEPALDAVINATARGLGGYTKGTASVMLREADADARLEVGLRDGKLVAMLGGGISGIRPRTGKAGKPVQVVISAKLGYDKTTDRVDIERVLIRVPEIINVGGSGYIKGIDKSPVGDININIADIDLNVVNDYLPKSMKLTGVVRPGSIRLAGQMKPFGMKAEGSAKIDNIRISYGKYGAGPINGLVGFEVHPDKGAIKGGLKAGLELLGGRVDAGAMYDGGELRFNVKGVGLDTTRIRGVPGQAQGIFGIVANGVYENGNLTTEFGADVFGGRLAGSLGYSNMAGRLKVTAEKVVLSDIKDLPVKVKGKLDARLDASTGANGRDQKADYSVTLSELSLPEKNASLARLSLNGNVVLTKSGVSSGGELNVSGFSGWGRKDGGLTADYKYSGGKLRVDRAGYKDGELIASLEGLTAVIGKAVKNIKLNDISADFRGGLVHIEGAKLDAEAGRTANGSLGPARCSLVLGKTEAYGLGITDARLDISGDGTLFSGKLRLKASGNPLTLEAKAKIEAGILKNHELSGNLDVKNLETLAPACDRGGLSISPSAGELHASFVVSGEGMEIDMGRGDLKLAGLAVESRGRTLATGVSCEFIPAYEGGRLTLPQTRIDFGGYFGLDVSAVADHKDDGWKGDASIGLAKTQLSSVQEGVIEALPERLMWADTSGYVSAGFKATYGGTGARLDGNIEFDAAKLGLPDMGLYIGPAYGRIPVGLAFAKKAAAGGSKKAPPPVFRGEAFDRKHYPALVSSYSKVPDAADIVIDSIRYGFVDLEAVTLALTPGDGWYDIDWFGLSAFKGNLYGYGRVDLEGGRHALSLILSNFSLTDLCNTVPSIKGYLSGRVDGLMRVVLSGTSYTGVTGAATFWAKDGPDEEREISKEFIKKLMGSSMKKYMSLFIGDRYFDTGELDIVFSKGDLVFEKLLIANTNFLGQHDLNITVAPVSNRISIEHLLEVIRDVGSRAKGM